MKRLLTILFVVTGFIFPQQLPKYAPGQAIVIFDQKSRQRRGYI